MKDNESKRYKEQIEMSQHLSKVETQIREFAVVKEAFLRLGYDYQLLPVDQVDDLPIGRGGAALVQ